MMKKMWSTVFEESKIEFRSQQIYIYFSAILVHKVIDAEK